MDGLNNEQEMALARVWMIQDSLPKDLTDWEITSDLIVLRDCRMIEMHTDWGHELAIVQGILPEGRIHYQKIRRRRKGFVNLRDSADELLDWLVVDCDKVGSNVPPPCYYEDRISDYRALSRAGLLDISWADNMPYNVQLTDKAWEYVEGTFSEEEPVINNYYSPVVYGGSATASANASATASNNVTLGMAIGSIVDLDDIDEDTKNRAQDSLKELDAFAKAKDKTSFAEKLEQAASIAKSASSLAGVMLPFFKTAIQTLLS